MSRQSINPLPDDDWETSFTKRIARNIARVKDEVGLTTEQLASLCSTYLGAQGAVKATTLNGLFAGKRKSVSAAELVMFSACLGVPVLALLVAPFDTDVELRPGHKMSTLRAVLTLSGLEPIMSMEPNPLNMVNQRASNVHPRDAGLVEAIYRYESAMVNFYGAFGSLMDGIESGLAEPILDQKVRTVQWELEEFSFYRRVLEGIRLPSLSKAYEFVDEISTKQFTLDFAREIYPIYAAERDEAGELWEDRPGGVGDGSPA